MIYKTWRGQRFKVLLERIIEQDYVKILGWRHLLDGEPDFCADLAGEEMELNAAKSRCGKPVYHLMVAWSPKDEVSSDQMLQVAGQLVDQLDLWGHQSVVVQHTNTDNSHIHIVVNRVHPYHGIFDVEARETRTVWRGGKDGAIIQSELRDIEQEYGWIENPGRLALREGQAIPEERSFSREKHDEQKAAGVEAAPISSGGGRLLFARNMVGAGSRCEKPVDHLMVAWSPKDEVAADQMRDVGERLLDRVGLSRKQAIAVQHADADRTHIHIVVDHVHPYHGGLDSTKREFSPEWEPVGDPGWENFWSIRLALRDMKWEYGWRDVPDRLVMREGRWDFRKDV